MIVVLGLGTTANATLILRGQDTLGNNLIYDNDLDITWYDFSNAANTWDNQVAWADTLSVDLGGDIFDDWRLPATVDGPIVFGFDGTTTVGYNITNSEMGHLYYTELGNKGFFATDGTNPQPGWGLINTGDFLNLNSTVYWSGTEFASNAFFAWVFTFSTGFQDTLDKSTNFSALAVRAGDVAAAEPVPEPSTMMLMGIGLAGLAGYGVRKRRQRR